MTHLSLFTGIGGLDLAAEWAGFRTAGQCEWADYPTRVLEKHWPNVPRWRDIHDITGDEVARKCSTEITVLSGGFPCQPHSLCGKRMASTDDRELSGEFLRVIREVRPRWVVAENVRGILTSEHGGFFGRFLRELAGMGYDVRWGLLSAFQAGMEHRRERLCVVANPYGFGWPDMGTGWEKLLENFEACVSKESQPIKAHNLFSHAIRVLRSRDRELIRNDDGIPTALDRLKCLGNAVVPQQFYPVFRLIAMIETQRSSGNDINRNHGMRNRV